MAASSGAKIGFAAVPFALILALAAILGQPGHEKRFYTTYWDALGQVDTACAGVTGEGVIRGKTYTPAECDAQLEELVGIRFVSLDRHGVDCRVSRLTSKPRSSRH